MFQTTRRRLALWYTTVTAILLLLFATTVYLYVRNTLIERVDDTLNHVVEVVERSLVIESVVESYLPYQVNVEASFHNNSEAVEDDHIDLEWFSPTGRLLWSTLSVPLAIPLNPNQHGETVYLSADQLLRQLTKRVEIGRYVLGYLRVSHPWFEVTKPSQQLIWDLTIGISFTLVSVAGIGWFLSGLAMKPVHESYQRLKQFTADASHELRNPIATIQTTVQVALADPDIDPQWQRQQLKVVERLTQRLGRLVNDLLFLARVDSGMVKPEWQTVHLDDLLMEVIEEQQLLADQKGILLSLHLVDLANYSRELNSDLIESDLLKVKDKDILIDLKSEVRDLPKPNSQSPIPNLNLDEDIFTIHGDWNQLARLFTNLVSNGVQYIPPSDRGSVQVELQRIDPLSKVGGRHKQSLLRVEVRDNGIGIPESELPHIFDRFYRVDPARPHDTTAGSGLGLAIAKAIVDNHHGQIQVDSIIGQGTTVTVILPNSVI